MATFHFQFRGELGWEAIGAGVGDGEDAIPEALDELRGFYDGYLPAGDYQVIEARCADPRWETFEIGARGRLVEEHRLDGRARPWEAAARARAGSGHPLSSPGPGPGPSSFS